MIGSNPIGKLHKLAAAIQAGATFVNGFSS